MTPESDDPADRSLRWAVPLAPAGLSLALSLSTVGDAVFWQDSGFYLAAIREFVPLYPPGFVLHVLLAKVWTFLVEPLAGFTRAVHLFSSACAAAAAAVVALAARDFLGRIFPERPRNLPAAGTGCLVAAGYSFAHAAILSKSYALFFLMLALLLWFMVRAERKGDFLLVGLFLGLSWAAHPLGAFVIPACIAYAVARRDRVHEWGWGWFGRVAGMAALGAWGCSLLLPVLGARQSVAGFGDPRTPAEFVRYLLGVRFLDQEGSFALVGAKLIAVVETVWEEYLVAGLVCAGLGVVEVARRRPRLLGLFAAWMLPIAGFTLIYVHEAYPDQWLVAVFLPAALWTAAGLSRLATGPAGLAGSVVLGGVVWMVAANRPDLDQRGYSYAADYGRALLRNLDPGVPVLLSTDDAISTTLALRHVDGEFADRQVLSVVFLWEDWYRAAVKARYGLRLPPPCDLEGVRKEDVWFTLLPNALAAPGKPVYCERSPHPAHLRPDLEAVPAGLFWRVGVRGEGKPDPRHWDFGVDPASVKRRRLRAHRIGVTADGWSWHRETYEDRLIQPLLLARTRLADPLLQRNPRRALEIYEGILAVDRSILEDPRFRYHRAVALHLTDRAAEAEAQFRALLAGPASPELRTMGHAYLGEIALAQKRPGEAATRFRTALEIGAADPAFIEHLRKRLEESRDRR
jgi:hypothetical protein